MLTHQQDANAVRDILSQHQWHVWVWTYQLSHFSMQLALHTGNHWSHLRILCTLCSRFEGSLAGGPYALELRDSGEAGERTLELCAQDGSFRLVCRMIRLIGHNDDLKKTELIPL